MASVYLFCHDASHIKATIVDEYTAAVENQKHLYFSAVHIQAGWRGYVVRKELKFLNNRATFIQKYVRGWLARLHYPERLKNYLMAEKVKFFNLKAAKIQAAWRSYAWRRENFSVKALISQRNELKAMGERLRQNMVSISKSSSSGDEHVSKEVRILMEKVLRCLYDQHHLTRTTQQEGIFSIHQSNELSAIEKVLKSISYKDYIKMKMKQETTIREIRPKSNKFDKKRKNFDLNTKIIRPEAYQRMLF